MKAYLSVMKYKTRYAAQKACPWATKICKCSMGWMAYEKVEEFDDDRRFTKLMDDKSHAKRLSEFKYNRYK